MQKWAKFGRTPASTHLENGTFFPCPARSAGLARSGVAAMVKFKSVFRPFSSAMRMALVLFFAVSDCTLAPRLRAQLPPNSEDHPTPAPAVQTAASSVVDPQLPPEPLGDYYMEHKRYQAAIGAYRRAPRFTAGLWNKLGIAEQQMRLDDEARKAYESSLKLDPNNSDVLNNLATIYYSTKQYSSAERLYRRALKLSPKDAIIHKNLGTAYLAEGKVKKGWESYQQAVVFDPNIFDQSSHYHVGDPTTSQQMGAMNYFMAKSYLIQGHLDKAIDYLRMAMDEGFTNEKKILEDKQFAVLRESPAFQLLLSEQRNQRATVKD
jgi:hypothetical protein